MSLVLLFCVSLLPGISSKFAASSVSCSGEISLESYAALEALYNSTAGLNWTWDPPLPSPTVWHFQSPFSAPCSESWQGLICSSNLSTSSCDIVSLELPHYNLLGTMPSELGNLVKLEALYLNDNSLEGSIPSELGNLVNLEVLNLYDNSLEGSLPSELGNLVNLTALYPADNALNGSIPSELGHLVNLEALDLSDNLLAGSIPSELCNLVKLEALYLNDNLLVGSIPSGLGNLVNLEGLSFSDNSLNGSLPSELGNLVNLQALYLYTNSLKGSIPSELGNLVKLEALEMYVNSLAGPIPSELGNLVKLEALYLNDNSLEGSIPSELGNLVNLEVLNLYDNSLEGSLPSELGNLVNLTALYPADNALNGSIPSELGHLVNLEALDLSDNLLAGSIPSELCNLVKLEALYLNDNLLVGSIPSGLGNLVNLEGLSFSDNSLNGSLPSELGNLVNLQALYLYTNSLKGSIPSELGNLVKLEALEMYVNSLAGPIPSELGNLVKLEALYLNDNSLKGSIPSELGNLVNLEVLDLSGNSLAGSISSNLGNLENLTVLYLNDNLLEGSIPSELGNLVNLEALILSGNSLEGWLPSELGNLVNLEALSLNDNSLRGALPQVMGGWSMMQSMNLSVNMFSGDIDLFAFENFTSLQVLDISLNSYSGTLPSAVFTLPALSSVVLSQNCFSGSLPSSMCLNKKLRSIVLDLLTGSCGSRSGEVFQGIVLAHYMTGTIPSCLWSSSSIRTLHLVGYVSMKVSSGDAYTPTYVSQYWWTSTIAFMHNWIISSFLVVALVGLSAVFTTTMVFLSRNTVTGEGIKYSSMSIVYRVSAHLVNVVVVTIVNGVYVLAAVGNVNSSSLLAIQASLGLFKLSWSSWVIPWLLARARMTDAHQISHWLFMVLFVFLGAPFASSFCESSSCFLYVLITPPQISFSLINPVIKFIPECSSVGCYLKSVPIGQLVQSSIPAPWIYSYQCSSAVITGYAPVLMMSYLASGIVIPFLILMISLFPSRWHGVVTNMMLIFEFVYFDNGTAAALLEKKSVSALGRKHVVKYILNFGVMMTFGLAVPLLAVAILCDTAFNTAVLLLLLGRFIGSCEENGLDASHLKQEFWNSFKLNSGEVSGSMFIVLGYASIFWSLFSFDWIADVYGSLAGGLVMLIPLLLPTMTGFWLLRWHRAVRKSEIVGRQETNRIELCETGNPVILPQTTNDGFSISEQ
jgi:Leucine-rich repeat (LRR) protein